MKKVIVSLVLTAALLMPIFANGGQETVTKEPDVIKIGVALPVTGNYAEYGKGMLAAIQFATDERNAAGGIKGKQIKLVPMDSKGDAKEAADIARIYTGKEDILAVITDFSSTGSMAAAPIYEEGTLTMISPTASHPDLPGMGNYIFGIMGRQSDEGPFMAEQVVSQYLGAKKVGIIYHNNDWGVSVMQNFEGACKDINLDITAKENFVDGEKDFTTALNKIRQTDPEVLVLLAQHNEVAMIAKQVKQMGWDIKLVSAGASYTDQLLGLGGKDVEGLISESPFILEGSNATDQAFIAEIVKRVNLVPGVHAAASYDAAGSLFDAIEAADSLTRTAIRDAYAKTANYPGLAGPITLDDVGGVHRKYRILTIENGKWKALTDYDWYN
jgi:branched-chain amino acid transport system substrate-binding protein